MAAKQDPLIIADLRGGRNGADSPLQLPEDQCVEALNVDWWEGAVANKRNGATALDLTFSSNGPFSGSIRSLQRHVPGVAESAAELWALDSTGQFGRLAGAVQWTEPTLVDAVSADGIDVTSASLGGFLFLAYNSAQNRLHVWDSSDSKVRRVGLATPDPPTVATQGGAGLSFTRYYRIRIVDIDGSDTKRRSEASTSVSITITDDAGVTVTQPTLPTNEDSTHWEVEYSSDNATWYRASQVAVATATYSDTAASISTTNVSQAAGLNYPPPSAKYLLTDDNRLIMGGCWETSGGYTTAKNNRVWWSSINGTLDIGDLERVVNQSTLKNYIDVEEAIIGMAGPLQGAIYVFGSRRIWKLVPTGISTAPYQRFTIRRDIGCIRHHSIVMAEDEGGNPAIYFLSHRGPYRIGVQGIQYLGNDIEDLWSTVSQANSAAAAHGLYHVDKHQVWWWIAVGATATTTLKLKFDTRLGVSRGVEVTGGWAKDDGNSAKAYCSVMFSNTVAASMSLDLKPYIGYVTSLAIWKLDSTATDDAGTAYQAYVDTKPYPLAGLGRNCSVGQAHVIGQVASGVTITVTPREDFGLRNGDAGTALLTAAGSETHVQKKCEAMQASGMGVAAFRIGDSAAASNQWTLDAVVVPWKEGEAR